MIVKVALLKVLEDHEANLVHAALVAAVEVMIVHVKDVQAVIVIAHQDVVMMHLAVNHVQVVIVTARQDAAAAKVVLIALLHAAKHAQQAVIAIVRQDAVVKLALVVMLHAAKHVQAVIVTAHQDAVMIALVAMLHAQAQEHPADQAMLLLKNSEMPQNFLMGKRRLKDV